MKSTDEGKNWTATVLPSAYQGFTGAVAVTALAIAPSTPATLYAANGGVLKSTDGGTTWANPAPHPNYQSYPSGVSAFAIDSADASTVYAVQFSNGVYKSTDGGKTWRNKGLNTVAAIAADPVSRATVYAGTSSGVVLRTTDGGDTWANLGSALAGGGIISLIIDPHPPSTLYAATSSKVFKNNGNGWIEVCPDHTLQNRVAKFDHLYNIALDLRTPGTFYALIPYWLVKSTSSACWTPISEVGYTALSVDPVNSSKLYVVKGGVFPDKSTNGGLTWATASTGLKAANVFALLVDPLSTSRLYAAYSGGFLRTTDAGTSWTMPVIFTCTVATIINKVSCLPWIPCVQQRCTLVATMAYPRALTREILGRPRA